MKDSLASLCPRLSCTDVIPDHWSRHGWHCIVSLHGKDGSQKKHGNVAVEKVIRFLEYTE